MTHGDPTVERGIAQTVEDRNGKTLVRQRSAFLSVEDRDGMMRSGTEEGVDDPYGRLDELLARLMPVG